MPKIIAIYPGSFDPITNGHLDLIARAAGIFDRVIVALAENSGKDPLFTREERRKLAEEAVRRHASVEVDFFSGLLVDYVEKRGARVILRGLRAVSDFDYELQMALMNRNLASRVETLFMTPKDTYTYLSSSLVKDIARLGGDVAPFVPPAVEAALRRKFRKKAR
ncbi:MAG: pantetheine-phosphate adenylyltransferase [Verrucomicrobiae bacterium]|nr:pantetheine-phosphate adenylyltransferase [Verrucomicrobiae bacterium]